MMKQKKTNNLLDKLNEFIKKYYLNRLIKGGIYSVSIILFSFLAFSILEHFCSFEKTGRAILFWIYILITCFIFIKLILFPLFHLFKFGRSLKHKDAAKIIGNHFSEVNDKLLNILELSEISNDDNSLIKASITQKTKQLSSISFKNAINFWVNKKHLKWALIPIIIIGIFIFSGKGYMLKESSSRIIQHNTFFEDPLLFKYLILNEELNCKQFDDFLLKIRIDSDEVPNEVYVVYGENRFSLKKTGNNIFEHKLNRIHSDLHFQLAAGNYLSKIHTIKCLINPKIVSLTANISPPKYTKKEKYQVENNGDLIVKEGSHIKWQFELEDSDTSLFLINNILVKKSTTNKLIVAKKILNNIKYSIVASSINNLNDSSLYSVAVIADEFPTINLDQIYDTINNTYIFNGFVEDDYMVKKLEFICSFEYNDSILFSKTIPIEKSSLEDFIYVLDRDLLNTTVNKDVKYYFKVWDNDEVNGSKFTKSEIFLYSPLNYEELIKKSNIEDLKTKERIRNSISLNKEIQKEMEELTKSIINKKEVSWQEREKAKKILEKQKKLENKIIENQKKNSINSKIKDQLNSSILEKQKKLDELMNSVLDEEMKELLKEMEEIVKNADKEKLKDLLDQLDKKNIDLEKELERELELFKQLEFEQKLEEALNKLSEVKEKQKKLKENTEQKLLNKDSLLKNQATIKNNMQKVEKMIEELREKNMLLEEKNEMPKTQNLEESIQELLEKSQNSLEKGMRKKSLKSQKNIVEKITELEEKLIDLQKSSSQDKPIEDMHSLREILENLITLSFDQEELMSSVEKTPKNSNKFVEILQQQKKLANNSKIIEDSLFALSKRVVQIQAIVNREIVSIKNNMTVVNELLESRSIPNATEKQQFIMTSINNLALLLSEILEQMQKDLEMPPNSNCNKPRNCNKPNPNSQKPSLSELKKAQKKLNEKIKKGQKGKGVKKGEKYAKQIMKLANEQEQIRNKLMQIRNEISENGEQAKIDKIIKKMEENEQDIINNKLNSQSLNRQEEIISRLLQAENSERERGQENKRKSVEWKYRSNNISEESLKYHLLKKNQKELLKTTPLEFTPYYKKKVKNYFKNILND